MIRLFVKAGSGLALLLVLSLLPLVGACSEKDTVTFGAVLPLSGDSAIYGQPIRNGIELAFEELQNRPDAEPMELKVIDTESDPQGGAQKLEQLYAEGARAVIGGITTPEAFVMVEVADRVNRVLLSPSASTPDLTGVSRNFYRVWPSDFREGTKMGQYAAQNLNLETAAILAAESPYAKGIETVFGTSFEQNGGEVVEKISYPANTTDFGALVDRVVALKPDCVYLADYAAPVGAIIALLKERGYGGKILTVSAFATPQAIAAAGRSAEGVFVTHPQYTPTDTDSPTVAAFVEAYQAKYDDTPGLFAAHGYDAMLILYEALKEGGDRGSSFWKGMRSVSDLQGVTGSLQFDEKGDVQKWPRVYYIVEGKLVDHSTWLEDQKEALRQRMEDLRRRRQQLQRQSDS